MEAKCNNPIFFFDELDKVSGHELIGQLIHLTDFTQNHDIKDKYFAGLSFDFSKCLFIFSFNDPSAIDPILLNRMSVIHVPGYTIDEKKHILTHYFLPKVLKDMGRLPNDIQFTDDALQRFLSHYVKSEEGMRNTLILLQQLCGNLLLRHLMNNIETLCTASSTSLHKSLATWSTVTFPYTITTTVLDAYMKVIHQAESSGASSHLGMYL